MSYRYSGIHVAMLLTTKNILQSSRIFWSVAKCLHDWKAYSMWFIEMRMAQLTPYSQGTQEIAFV